MSRHEGVLSGLLMEWIKAADLYRDCMNGCEFDTDYFCDRYRQEMEGAEERFLDALAHRLATASDKMARSTPTNGGTER